MDEDEYALASHFNLQATIDTPYEALQLSIFLGKQIVSKGVRTFEYPETEKFIRAAIMEQQTLSEEVASFAINFRSDIVLTKDYQLWSAALKYRYNYQRLQRFANVNAVQLDMNLLFGATTGAEDEND